MLQHLRKPLGPEAKVATFAEIYLFIIKQDGINKKFQKFSCKPQLACFVCSFACSYDVTYVKIQFNHSKLHKFVKNGQKQKTNKKMQKKKQG